MKKKLILILFLLHPFVLIAQQQIVPSKVEIEATYMPDAGASYLITEVYFDLPQGDTIRNVEPSLLEMKYFFTGIDPNLLESDKHQRYVTFEHDKLIFMFSSKDKEFASKLSRQIQDQSLLLDQDLKLYTAKKKHFVLTADTLRDFSRGKLNMAKGQEKDLYRNFLRFGITQAAEQWGAGLQFEALKKYSWKWMYGLSYHAEAYVGTQSESPLYYLKAFPLVLTYEKSGKYSAQFGMETDQPLNNIRISTHLNGNWVLPFHPFDFSKDYHRFHLFPLLTGGVSFYHALKTSLPDEEIMPEVSAINMQLYAGLNYYFPVLEKLNFHLNAKAFYDTNSVLNEDTNLFYHLQIGAGYSLSAQTKIYMQFIKGYNEVSLQEKEGILVGMAVEFF
jgi:hypothetical protein